MIQLQSQYTSLGIFISRKEKPGFTLHTFLGNLPSEISKFISYKFYFSPNIRAQFCHIFCLFITKITFLSVSTIAYFSFPSETLPGPSLYSHARHYFVDNVYMIYAFSEMIETFSTVLLTFIQTLVKIFFSGSISINHLLKAT